MNKIKKAGIGCVALPIAAMLLLALIGMCIGPIENDSPTQRRTEKPKQQETSTKASEIKEYAQRLLVKVEAAKRSPIGECRVLAGNFEVELKKATSTWNLVGVDLDALKPIMQRMERGLDTCNSY